jgi:hypothetical protein
MVLEGVPSCVSKFQYCCTFPVFITIALMINNGYYSNNIDFDDFILSFNKFGSLYE